MTRTEPRWIAAIPTKMDVIDAACRSTSPDFAITPSASTIPGRKWSPAFCLPATAPATSSTLVRRPASQP